MSTIEACPTAQRPRPRINVPEQPVELTFDITPKPYLKWKSVPDRIVAAGLLIPAAPIIGMLVVAVRLTSRGPGIYRQVRTGKSGQPFTMLKIRTMSRDAESGTGVVWTQTNDVRITWLGRVLRKLHLDEFPQLWNVVRGEMSLIGPRPERPEFVEVLEDAVPGYINRLVVLPGVTGLAQINLPPDSDLDGVRRKLVLDMAYIDEAGPWLDIRMLLCTSIRLLGIPGDVVMSLFGLRRECPEDTPVSQPRGSDNGPEPEEMMTPAKISSAQSLAGNHNGNGNGHPKPFDPHKPR